MYTYFEEQQSSAHNLVFSKREMTEGVAVPWPRSAPIQT